MIELNVKKKPETSVWKDYDEPFAELKLAQSNGAHIEYYNVSLQQWIVTTQPEWNPNRQYRILVPKITRYVYTCVLNGALVFIPCERPDATLELKFDGDTGKLCNTTRIPNVNANGLSSL